MTKQCEDIPTPFTLVEEGSAQDGSAHDEQKLDEGPDSHDGTCK